MKTLLIAVALLITTPALAVNPPTPEEIQTAKTAVAAQLIDPTSPVFPEVWMNRKGEVPVFCGMIRGRNAFGGYSPTPSLFVVQGDRAAISNVRYGSRGWERWLGEMVKMCGTDALRVQNF